MKYISILFISILFLANACQSGQPTPPASPDQAPDGKALFNANCRVCHGADGKLGLNGAKDLSASTLSLEERRELVRNGRNAMTPFVGILSEKEIQAVAEYSMKFGRD